MSEKKEYIERGALLKAFGCENAVKYGNKNAEQQHKSYSSMMLYEIADEIYDAPAADVEPVVLGEWDKTKYNEHDFRTYYCSICGKREYYFNATQYAYCPHCGARMQNGAHMMERSGSGDK